MLSDAEPPAVVSMSLFSGCNVRNSPQGAAALFFMLLALRSGATWGKLGPVVLVHIGKASRADH
jgi:hypothetical protein